jgi:hypothetical protein
VHPQAARKASATTARRFNASAWLALLLAALVAFSVSSSGSAHALAVTHADSAGWQDIHDPATKATAQLDEAPPVSCDRSSHKKAAGCCCMASASCALWAPAAEPSLAGPPQAPPAFDAEAARLTPGILGLELRPPRLLTRA